MRLAKKLWPKYLRELKEIRGFSYGRCAFHFEDTFDGYSAHAHCDVRYPHTFGWICMKNKSMIHNRQLMAHEFAHIFVGAENNHNRHWRRWCIEFGGSLSDVSWYIGKRARRDGSV